MAKSTPRQFGDLLLQFTTDFEEAYDDQGSGASRDGSFWTPVPSQGFYILGSFGRDNYDNPNGEHWALCVRQTVVDSNALLHPVDWVEVWNDRGSSSNGNGSCWEPVPPSGYVALGHLFVRGYEKPRLNTVVCVREDLTVPGLIGTSVWDDQGDQRGDDIRVWNVDAPPGTSDGVFLIAANTLFAVPNYSQPAFHRSANVLRLPLDAAPAQRPILPRLTSQTQPDEVTEPVVDHAVLVPFTAVSDPGRSLAWQISNSPFYTVERATKFELVIFLRNEFARDQTTTATYETGVSTTRTSQFSVTTGITVSYETGVAIGPISSKVSASLSIELGYTESTSVSMLQSRSTTASMEVPGCT